MVVLLILLVFTIVTAVEAPILIKQRMWKELMAFFVMICLGILYSIGQFYDWPLPNPEKYLEYKFIPISKMVENLLS